MPDLLAAPGGDVVTAPTDREARITAAAESTGGRIRLAVRLAAQALRLDELDVAAQHLADGIAAMDEETEAARAALGWTYDRADIEEQPTAGEHELPPGVVGWVVPRQEKQANAAGKEYR